MIRNIRLRRGTLPGGCLLFLGILALLSCEDSVGPEVPSLPTPTQFEAAPTGPRTVRLKWTMPSSSEVVAFDIDRRVNLQGDFEPLTTVALTNLTVVGTQAQYLDVNLDPETFYGYRLRSSGTLGKISGYSTVAGARTADAPGIEVVTVSITETPDVDGYTVRVTGPQTLTSLIGADDRKTFKPLPNGTYQVELTGLESRCAFEVGGALQNATVDDEGMETVTRVTYQVRCRDPNKGRVVARVVAAGNAIPASPFELLLSGVASGGGGAVSRSVTVPPQRVPGSTAVFDDLVAGDYEVKLQGFDVGVCSVNGANPVKNLAVGALTTDTVGFEVACRTGVDPAQANVLGRWVNSAGTPVTGVKPGTPVRLQVCTKESGIEAWDAKLVYTPTLMTLDSITSFNSAAATGVHSDCKGTTDLLDDFFVVIVGGGAGSSLPLGQANFGLSRLEEEESVGRVGIVTAWFTPKTAGTEFVGLEVANFAKTGTVPVTPLVQVDSLVLDPNIVTNVAPVARPGGPYTGKVGTPVTFDGSASSDSDGSVVRYDWVFGDGQGAADGGPTPTHTYANPGSYSVTLTVRDNEGAGAQGSTTVTVSPSNSPPVAKAGGPYLAQPDSAATFNGGGSSDPEAGPLTYSWVFGDGATSSEGPTTKHTYTAEGDFKVILTVADTAGLTDSDTTSVKVRRPGTVNKWRNTWAADSVFMDSVIVLNVTSRPEQIITFAQGTIRFDTLSVRYDSAKAGTFSTALFQVNRPNPGQLDIGARATNAPPADVENKIASLYFTALNRPGDSIKVPTTTSSVLLSGPSPLNLTGLPVVEDTLLVRTDNLRPTAKANGPYAGRVGDALSFSASGSLDKDGMITFYDWEFGDGEHGVGPSPSHVYDSAGVYDVELKVTDNRGLVDVDSTTATITPNIDPSANANGPYRAALGEPVSFTASGSVDTDGRIVSFRWDFGDGSEGFGPAPLHTYFRSGQFTAVLTVTDNNGGEGVASAPVAIAFPDAYAIRNQWINRSPRPSPSPFAVSGNFDGPGATAGPGDRVELAFISRPDPGSAVVDVDFVIQWDSALVRYDSIRKGSVFNADFSTTRRPNVGRLAYLEISGLGTTPLPELQDTPLASAFFTVLGLEGDSLKTSTTGVFLKDSQGNPQADTIPVLESTLRIREGGENKPPVADAGGPYTGQAGTPVNFNGLGSRDPDGVVMRYDWVIAGGAGLPNVGPTPRYTFAEAGVYLIGVKVYDNEGATDVDEAQVVVTAAPPTADAGGPYTAVAGVPLMLNGGGSSDPDGTVVSYAWTFGDGATGTGVSPSHTYAAAGSYVVTLSVTDDAGLKDTDSAAVTVAPPGAANLSPTANAGGPYAGPVGTPIAFDGSGSSDPDGSITQYAWTFGDGASGSGATPTHTYASAGTYTVTLTVRDDDGATDNGSATVTVQPEGGGNAPPTANAGGPYSGTAGSPIAFDGSGSSDSDGSIVQYAWIFGDGGTGTGVSPSYTYPTEGTYTVSLTVLDDDGATGQATAQVTVAADGPPPNVLLRWMDSSGNPITTAAVGQTVKAQICSPLNLEVGEGKLNYSSRLTYASANGLNSAAATGVHPDCRGTTDVLKDLFLASSPEAGQVNFGDVAFGTSGENVGVVGIAEITFTVAAKGSEAATLTNLNLQVFGGTLVPGVPNVQALVIQ